MCDLVLDEEKLCHIEELKRTARHMRQEVQMEEADIERQQSLLDAKRRALDMDRMRLSSIRGAIRDIIMTTTMRGKREAG